MSLPFLPAADIPAAFETPRSRATNDKLVKLVSYMDRLRLRNDLYCVEWGVKLYSLTHMDRQCVHHSVWSAKTWYVCRRAVRTNNDCESWHSGLNRQAETCHLALYKLTMVLFREAKAVEVSLKLLSDGKVQRMTSKSRSHVQTKLVKLWNEYMIGEKNHLSNYCVHVLTCMRQWSLD